MKEPDPIALAFGRRVKALREAKGLDKNELGARARVSESAIYRLEKGRHAPRIDTAVRIAAALGYTLPEFLTLCLECASTNWAAPACERCTRNGQAADYLTPIEQEIRREQLRQFAKFGEQNHPDGTGDAYPGSVFLAETARAECQKAAANGATNWRLVLLEEVFEASAEHDRAKLRPELVQVAATAQTWVDAIDRATTAGGTP